MLDGVPATPALLSAAPAHRYEPTRSRATLGAKRYVRPSALSVPKYCSVPRPLLVHGPNDDGTAPVGAGHGINPIELNRLFVLTLLAVQAMLPRAVNTSAGVSE